MSGLDTQAQVMAALRELVPGVKPGRGVQEWPGAAVGGSGHWPARRGGAGLGAGRAGHAGLGRGAAGGGSAHPGDRLRPGWPGNQRPGHRRRPWKPRSPIWPRWRSRPATASPATARPTTADLVGHSWAASSRNWSPSSSRAWWQAWASLTRWTRPTGSRCWPRCISTPSRPGPSWKNSRPRASTSPMITGVFGDFAGMLTDSPEVQALIQDADAASYGSRSQVEMVRLENQVLTSSTPAIRAIRAAPALPDIPLVVLSATTTDSGTPAEDRERFTRLNGELRGERPTRTPRRARRTPATPSTRSSRTRSPRRSSAWSTYCVRVCRHAS